jgi:MYXO-CTERM domain-containing protein
MNRMKVAARVALLCLGLAGVHAASAGTSTGLTSTGAACAGNGTELTSQAGFVACSGAWSGNNRNQFDAIQAQALTDWGLDLTAATALATTPNANSGVLTFAPETGKFVISLKTGNGFSLYEFDGSHVAGGISSIDFDTLGIGFQAGKSDKGKEHLGQGLSHADLYTVVSATTVPEPGSALMVLAGLGALAFVSRRR